MSSVIRSISLASIAFQIGSKSNLEVEISPLGVSNFMAGKFEEDFDWWAQNSSPEFWKKILCWCMNNIMSLVCRRFGGQSPITSPVLQHHSSLCKCLAQDIFVTLDNMVACYSKWFWEDSSEMVSSSWCWTIASLQVSTRYDTLWIYSCSSDEQGYSFAWQKQCYMQVSS